MGKVGDLKLRGRCHEALELAEKARAASEHLQAAIEILDELGEVELNYEVIAYDPAHRSGGSASIPVGHGDE